MPLPLIPPVPPPGAPPSAFPVPLGVSPVPPGLGKIGLGMGGAGAGKPGGAGAGNGAGTAAGESTAPTFIAVNATKEKPIAQIAMTRMSVCILSSQSKQHAYYVTGTITRKARNASSNLKVKAHHFG